MRPNNLWTDPPRPAVDPVEAERIRSEIANDPALIAAARNYKPNATTLRELEKYTPRSQAEILRDLQGMVLP